jgi:predicted metal-dependent hydrolase
LFDEPRQVEEPRIVRLGEREIPFLLKRSVNRRRAVLTVDDRGLTLSVPWRTSERYIAHFLHDSSKWVLRKLEAWELNKPKPRKWEEGEWLDYLGRQLVLRVGIGPHATVTLEDGERLSVVLSHPDSESVRVAVLRWYRRHAGVYFQQRIEHYSSVMAVAPPRLFLSNARTRWGSCNSQAQVRLNWRLIQARPAVIDYVVVHELAHLKVMNHSARFWRLVERMCPDFEQSKVELNAMGQHYMAL